MNLQRSSRPTIVYHVNFLLIFSNFKFLRLSLTWTSSFLIRSVYTSAKCYWNLYELFQDLEERKKALFPFI